MLASVGLIHDPNAIVSGSIRYIMIGPEALHWRQLALQNDPEEVKKQFNESLRGDMPEGVEVDFDHFLALDDYESNLMAIVKVSGGIATATGLGSENILPFPTPQICTPAQFA